MGRVYSNSVCNLAATGSPTGQEGLLVPGRLREIIPPQVNYGQHSTENLSASYYICVSRRLEIADHRVSLTSACMGLSRKKNGTYIENKKLVSIIS
jgi:hypothetical protein